MTDPAVSLKNPARVPLSLRQLPPAEQIGTAGTFRERMETPLMASDFRFNPQTGAHEVQQDGVYERQADNPADRVRVKFRKGHALPEADAKLFKRVGPWPGDDDPARTEAQATEARAMNAPANKAAQAPENKTG